MKKIFSLLLVLSVIVCSCSKSDSVGTGKPNNGSGQGGSLARFTIAGSYLYVVDNQSLYTYSLLNKNNPQLKSTVYIGYNIETIYPYGNKLFVGSQDAMYIYSISNPELPVSIGTASHVRSCDPVVANDTMAYVTVRSGSNCGGTTNALMVYDVKNMETPKLITSIDLSSPWGLGIKGNRLYVCNGTSGLKVYDISKPSAPKEIRQLTEETFYDVIITPDNMLICMIEGGMAIYQLGPNDRIDLLAKITE